MYEEQLSKALSVEGLSQQDIEGALETPKEPKLGDICLPCFKFARAMRLAPPVIAAKLLPYAQEQEFVDRAEVAGGYLNIFFKTKIFRYFFNFFIRISIVTYKIFIIFYFVRIILYTFYNRM